MIMTCFSPDDSLESWTAAPFSMATTILPVSDMVRVLLTKRSLTMSLKTTTDSASRRFLEVYSSRPAIILM